MLGFPYLFAAHTRCPNALQKQELLPKSLEFWQSLQYTLSGNSFFAVFCATAFFAMYLVIVYHHQFIFIYHYALSGQSPVE